MGCKACHGTKLFLHGQVASPATAPDMAPIEVGAPSRIRSTVIHMTLGTLASQSMNVTPSISPPRENYENLHESQRDHCCSGCNVGSGDGEGAVSVGGKS